MVIGVDKFGIAIHLPMTLVVLFITDFNNSPSVYLGKELDGTIEYTNLASGFRAVGINPANLAVYNTASWNIIDFSFGLSNNYFSINNYNTLSGAHLNDDSDPNHYPQDQMLNKFGGIGLRLKQSINFPLLDKSLKPVWYLQKFSILHIILSSINLPSS